jgi:hypothetical protein
MNGRNANLNNRPRAVSARMQPDIQSATRERNPDAGGFVDGVALGVLEPLIFFSAFPAVPGVHGPVDPARQAVKARGSDLVRRTNDYAANLSASVFIPRARTFERICGPRGSSEVV